MPCFLGFLIFQNQAAFFFDTRAKKKALQKRNPFGRRTV
jgi:hypothetical protein